MDLNLITEVMLDSSRNTPPTIPTLHQTPSRVGNRTGIVVSNVWKSYIYKMLSINLANLQRFTNKSKEFESRISLIQVLPSARRSGSTTARHRAPAGDTSPWHHTPPPMDSYTPPAAPGPTSRIETLSLPQSDSHSPSGRTKAEDFPGYQAGMHQEGLCIQL